MIEIFIGVPAQAGWLANLTKPDLEIILPGFSLEPVLAAALLLTTGKRRRMIAERLIEVRNKKGKPKP